MVTIFGGINVLNYSCPQGNLTDYMSMHVWPMHACMLVSVRACVYVCACAYARVGLRACVRV